MNVSPVPTRAIRTLLAVLLLSAAPAHAQPRQLGDAGPSLLHVQSGLERLPPDAARGSGTGDTDLGPADLTGWFRSPAPVLVLGMGDSVTWGYGASDRTETAAFRVMLRKLRERGLRPRYLNLAANGTTSFDHVENQIPALERHLNGVRAALGAPAFATFLSRVQVEVMLTTGGNDLLHAHGRPETSPHPDAMFGCTAAQARGWAPAFARRLRLLVQAVEAAFPGRCRIHLATIFDPTDGTGRLEELPLGGDPTRDAGWASGAQHLPAWPSGRQQGLEVLDVWNGVIRGIAAEASTVSLVDMRALFAGHGYRALTAGATCPTYWYAPILEDPNDLGHAALGALLAEQVLRVSRSSGPPARGS